MRGPRVWARRTHIILGVVLYTANEFFLHSGLTYRDSWKFPEVLVIPIDHDFLKRFSYISVSMWGGKTFLNSCHTDRSIFKKLQLII